MLGGDRQGGGEGGTGDGAEAGGDYKLGKGVRVVVMEIIKLVLTLNVKDVQVNEEIPLFMNGEFPPRVGLVFRREKHAEGRGVGFGLGAGGAVLVENLLFISMATDTKNSDTHHIEKILKLLVIQVLGTNFDRFVMVIRPIESEAHVQLVRLLVPKRFQLINVSRFGHDADGF